MYRQQQSGFTADTRSNCWKRGMPSRFDDGAQMTQCSVVLMPSPHCREQKCSIVAKLFKQHLLGLHGKRKVQSLQNCKNRILWFRKQEATNGCDVFLTWVVACVLHANKSDCCFLLEECLYQMKQGTCTKSMNRIQLWHYDEMFRMYVSRNRNLLCAKVWTCVVAFVQLTKEKCCCLLLGVVVYQMKHATFTKTINWGEDDKKMTHHSATRWIPQRLRVTACWRLRSGLRAEVPNVCCRRRV